MNESNETLVKKTSFETDHMVTDIQHTSTSPIYIKKDDGQKPDQSTKTL